MLDSVSRQDARTLPLASQGLLDDPARRRGLAEALERTARLAGAREVVFTGRD
jgi:uncharacterized protein YcaQ